MTDGEKMVPYQLIGGAPVVKQIVERFYDLMDQEPAAAGIRAMHAEDLGPMRERLFEFLSAWLGGPTTYFQRPDAKCIGHAHEPFAIGESERDQWMLCMRKAMDEAELDNDVREIVDQALFRMADALRTR